jgi:predicted RNase H-like HicB family nuclease
MKSYIAIAEHSDDGSWWISFPGIDGVISAAEDPDHIVRQAQDALATAVDTGRVLPPAIEDGGIPTYNLAEFDRPRVVVVPYSMPSASAA